MGDRKVVEFHKAALSPEGQRLQAAREELAAAMDAVKAAAIRDVREHAMPETEAARQHGIDRMTLRKALGKV